MKVLIIGGTGLISTSITKQLIERGDTVVLYNRGITPAREISAFRTIVGDRNDEKTLSEAINAEKPDAIIDMVAFDPAQAEMLVRVANGKSPQIVACSTVGVYRMPLLDIPASEASVTDADSNVGKAKLRIEEIILGRANGKEEFGTIIRPAHTTGEGEIQSGILFDDSLIQRFRQGLPVIIPDDGQTMRCVAHTSDVASAFVACLGNPKAINQAYHVTGTKSETWESIYMSLARAAGSGKPKLINIPTSWLLENAPKKSIALKYFYRHEWCFDNSKAADDLGYQQRVPTDDIFNRQIAWMDSQKLTDLPYDNFQDELISAWSQNRQPIPHLANDSNPWGNRTEI